jgi:UDP-glucose 4-epimerase
VGKLVYASSSSVYGNAKPPMREDAHTPPVNFYASTKLFNEHYASLFSKEYGLETIGLRYMSVYGPREHSKGVFANLVSQFLWAMQKDEPPVIYGDGTQTRDFTFVSDIVQANILAMNSGFSSEVFNVGTGRCVSLNELVSIINRLLGKSIEPRYIENKVKNYIAAQIGDITKARRMLGYSPRYDLETGISEILASEQAA